MPRTILCVDDDESITSVLAHLLNAKGHKVSVAADGREAIALIRAMDFDVVITDHQMPEMTGLELVRHLRVTAFRGRTFVFSGALSPTLRTEYEALKVDAIFAKPTGISEIVARLQMP